MKYIITFCLLILLLNSLFCQDDKAYTVKISKTSLLIVDSIIQHKNLEKYKVMSQSSFRTNILNSPEKTVHEFISFDTKDWARDIVSKNYNLNFPDKKLLELRNSRKYKQKAYIKIYFTVYFKNDSTQYAGCLTEAYVSEEFPLMYFFNMLKLENGKWLQTHDVFTNKVSVMSILKPEFLFNLLSGKKIEGNYKYNELLSKVYKENILNLKTLDTLLFDRRLNIEKTAKEESYSELLNKYSLTYFLQSSFIK